MKHFCLVLAAVLLLLCAGCGAAQEAPSAGGLTDVRQPDSASAAPDAEMGQSAAMSETGIENTES